MNHLALLSGLLCMLIGNNILSFVVANPVGADHLIAEQNRKHFLGEPLHTYGILHRKELRVDKVIAHNEGISVGKAKWNMEDAIIKCAQYETRVNHITAEINAYKILNEASQRLKNEQADGEEYIVKYKTRFATIATINRKRIGYYCFITSYDGDILLSDYIHSVGFVERLFTTSLFSYQLLQGINYLHRAGLIHGDIKMENIIIKKSPTLKATFIDFDLSVPLFSADTKDVVEPKLIVGGNLAHASPEIFCNIKHDPRKTDMWALGVLLYEILYKQTPFHHSLKEAEARNRLCDYMNKIGKLRDSQLKLPVPVTLTRYTSEQQELAILLLHEVYTMLIPRVEDRPTPKDYLQWRDSLPTITTKAYKLRWGINVDLPH